MITQAYRGRKIQARKTLEPGEPVFTVTGDLASAGGIALVPGPPRDRDHQRCIATGLDGASRACVISADPAEVAAVLRGAA